MLRAGWGRIVNISMNYKTMRRGGFSPYGPSKAALESETIIWAQDLARTGVTVNALLPGGATHTGMIPSDLRSPSGQNCSIRRLWCRRCSTCHRNRTVRVRGGSWPHFGRRQSWPAGRRFGWIKL